MMHIHIFVFINRYWLRCSVVCQVGDRYEVYSFDSQSLHMVSGNLDTCSCGLSVNIGIPCSHVFAVLAHTGDCLFRPELVADRLSMVSWCFIATTDSFVILNILVYSHSGVEALSFPVIYSKEFYRKIDMHQLKYFSGTGSGNQDCQLTALNFETGALKITSNIEVIASSLPNNR